MRRIASNFRIVVRWSQFVENTDDRGNAVLGMFRPSVKP
jgi:hypothetical protein